MALAIADRIAIKVFPRTSGRTEETYDPSALRLWVLIRRSL
jgi:hypothetical protein